MTSTEQRLSAVGRIVARKIVRTEHTADVVYVMADVLCMWWAVLMNVLQEGGGG